GERVLGNLVCTPPAVGIGLASQRPVAGEGELATGCSRRALIDDAADAVRESGMADAVEHHLRDCALAVFVLVAGFVIDRAGKAFERLGPGRGIALEHERRSGRVWPARERDLGIDL